MARWQFTVKPQQTPIECTLETTELVVGTEGTFTFSFHNPTDETKNTDLTIEVYDGPEKTLLTENEAVSIAPDATVEKQYNYTPETTELTIKVNATGI